SSFKTTRRPWNSDCRSDVREHISGSAQVREPSTHGSLSCTSRPRSVMRHRANLGFLVAFLSIGLVRCAEVENTNGHGGPSLSAPGGAGGVSGAGTEQEGGAISAFGGHSPGGTPTSGGAPLGGASFGGNGGTMPGASGAPPSGGIG